MVEVGRVILDIILGLIGILWLIGSITVITAMIGGLL